MGLVEGLLDALRFVLGSFLLYGLIRLVVGAADRAWSYRNPQATRVAALAGREARLKTISLALFAAVMIVSFGVGIGMGWSRAEQNRAAQRPRFPMRMPQEQDPMVLVTDQGLTIILDASSRRSFPPDSAEAYVTTRGADTVGRIAYMASRSLVRAYCPYRSIQFISMGFYRNDSLIATNTNRAPIAPDPGSAGAAMFNALCLARDSTSPKSP